MNPSCKSKRNREILFNYESGKSVKDLMWIHQISIPRVYQIINKEKKRLEEEGIGMNEMALEIHRLKCKEFILDRELEFCINFIARLGLIDKKQMLDAIKEIHSKCRALLDPGSVVLEEEISNDN